MNGKDQFDAVILAGTHRSSKRRIQGKNKAFLQINGTTMIEHVVAETLKCENINMIIVIGPREKLQEVLMQRFRDESRLKIIQQRSRLLENVWTGFLASFPDGNNLPFNREIETLLLGGHLPIKKKTHLYMFKSVYAAVAAQMNKERRNTLPKGHVIAAMDRRFDEFRRRHERQEWFMGRVGIETILKEGHVLEQTEEGIAFQNEALQEYFIEWENRFNKGVFLTACDLPLLKSDAISDFIHRCIQQNHDFYFSVSTSDILENFYKGEDENIFKLLQSNTSLQPFS